ncbi:MAG: TolC family protein [Polymorphobacter sp.]|uniref:TolC family protein n=1 Tax=Polymorphobacter sp. TaxID=1909290 RepID=UPI003A862F70
MGAASVSTLALPLLALMLAVPGALGAQTGYGPGYGPPVQGRAAMGEALVLPPEVVPPALQEAVGAAVQGYPAVAGARAEATAREADLRGAKWQRFPSLTVDALALGGGNQFNNDNGLVANVTVEQPLWTGGRINGGIDRAEALLTAGGNAVRETQMDIALRTVQAYYDLVFSTRREAIIRAGLARQQRLVDTIGRRVAQEVSPRADLELARSRIAQLEQDLAATLGQRQTSYNQLLQLVGRAQFDLGPVPVWRARKVAGVDEAAIQRALECSPQIARLQFETQAAEAERKVARGSLFPQLVAQASRNEVTGTRAGLALRLQTGNGLSQVAAVSSAASRIDALTFQRLEAERDLGNAVQQDLVIEGAARSRAEAGSRAAEASDLVTASYERQFLAGRRTWPDVMNAVREALAAELSVAEAETSAMAATARILLRSCAWAPAMAGDDERAMKAAVAAMPAPEARPLPEAMP